MIRSGNQAVSDPFILMHISDLHFHRLPRNPGAYLSKRALGALNLVLQRRRQFPLERARRLVARLADQPWHHLLITGDLTQLGTPAEFALAREVLEPLLAAGPERVTMIPGNHDRYVAERAGQGAFEAYFGAFCAATHEQPAPPRQLTEQWWLTAWDSARPTAWNAASGVVSTDTLRATAAWLAEKPAASRLIVANHYPVFFPPPHAYHEGHDLRNQEQVASWLLSHPVRLYLHGHVHHNWQLTIQGEHGALTAVNSAASTQLPKGPEQSAYHRIVLEGGDFRVQPQRLE